MCQSGDLISGKFEITLDKPKDTGKKNKSGWLFRHNVATW